MKCGKKNGINVGQICTRVQRIFAAIVLVSLIATSMLYVISWSIVFHTMHSLRTLGIAGHLSRTR